MQCPPRGLPPSPGLLHTPRLWPALSSFSLGAWGCPMSPGAGSGLGSQEEEAQADGEGLVASVPVGMAAGRGCPGTLAVLPTFRGARPCAAGTRGVAGTPHPQGFCRAVAAFPSSSLGVSQGGFTTTWVRRVPPLHPQAPQSGCESRSPGVKGDQGGRRRCPLRPGGHAGDLTAVPLGCPQRLLVWGQVGLQEGGLAGVGPGATVLAGA